MNVRYTLNSEHLPNIYASARGDLFFSIGAVSDVIETTVSNVLLNYKRWDFEWSSVVIVSYGLSLTRI